MRLGVKLTVAALAFANATSSQSATLFTNAPDLGVNRGGDCVYNTTCGPQYTGNTYAAQLFTLSSASQVTGFGFNSIVYAGGLGSTYGTAASYQILSAVNGLPSALIIGGKSLLSHAAGPLGSTTTDYSFSVSPLQLTAGDYFLAFQDVTKNTSDFLSRGIAPSGAFTSNDGGANYFSGYRGFGSVAISVFGNEAVAPVPEPATWALMLVGFAMVGFAMRRRLHVPTTVSFA